MAVPHVLLIPYPAQGHVNPFTELSHRLSKLGLLVTLVHTEFRHAHIMAARRPEDLSSERSGGIRLATIPDGAADGDERRDRSRFFDVIQRSMPKFLEELIVKINKREENRVSYVIVDGFLGFLLNVVEKLNIPRAAFFPASAWQLASLLSIRKLLDSGSIDHRGFVKDYDKVVDILVEVPPIKPKHLCWVNHKHVNWQVSFFEYLCNSFEAVKRVDHILCNSFEELELPVLRHLKNTAVPIGPLISVGNALPQPSFWAEDLSCIDWLDRQTDGSVIYVSFGGITELSQNQIGEIVLGLELTSRPFLLVCRPGLMDGSADIDPDGFLDRVPKQGRVINWAPQKEVLSHPAVACFLTHCGWNSVLESLSNGVPMLCWPNFCDQFQNQTYVVELWKVGLALAEDWVGIVRKEEIKEKIEDLLKDDGIRKRIAELKDRARSAVMEVSGDSIWNLQAFASIVKGSETNFGK
ncbi:unnamed protein product [Victoria cruziana]